MAPPTTTQRLDTVEEGITEVRNSITGFRQALQQQFSDQMAVITEKLLAVITDKLSAITAENVTLRSSIREENANLRSSIQEEVQTILSDSHQAMFRSTMVGSNQSGGGSGVNSGGGSGGTTNGGGLNWRFRKLDMPLFDGVNLDGWILKAERYFNFYRLNEGDKLEATIVALEGDALL